MATSDKPFEVKHVACEMCLKEVPISEATIPEATDYFVHFCGLECYEKWKNQGGVDIANTTGISRCSLPSGGNASVHSGRH